MGRSRAATDLIEFAEKHQIPIAKDKRGEAPFSVDANLLHSSSEGKVLEDPAVEAAAIRLPAHDLAEEAPDKATEIKIGFEKGDAVSHQRQGAVARRPCSTTLNELGRDNGIGRLDLVENRFVGMKSRGVYETPGGTILLAAHRAIEIASRSTAAPAHLKDELMPRYAELIYNGFWFSARARDAAGADRQEPGARRGRGALSSTRATSSSPAARAPKSLYSSTLVTFEDDKGAYDQKDAEGFIRLNALRLRTLAMRGKLTGSEVRPRRARGASTLAVPGTPLACGAQCVRRGSAIGRQDVHDVRVRPDRRHPDLSRHVLRAGADPVHLPLLHGGDTQAMSMGFIIIVGILVSILLHELGHAFPGRLFKARQHIELTGIGGIAHSRALAADLGAGAHCDLPRRPRRQPRPVVGFGRCTAGRRQRQPS